MMSNVWSVLTIPALFAIWVTAFFGLNAARPPNLKAAMTWPGAIDFGVGIGFLAMTASSFMMLLACVMGANIYTWRGSLLMWSIAVIFVLAGKFSPWHRIFRRKIDLEKLEEKWEGHEHPTLDDLSELIAEGRKALATRGKDRAEECMKVLPHILVALKKLTVKQYQVYNIQTELKAALADLRKASSEDDLEPLVAKVNELLDRLEGIIHHA